MLLAAWDAAVAGCSDFQGPRGQDPCAGWGRSFRRCGRGCGEHQWTGTRSCRADKRREVEAAFRWHEVFHGRGSEAPRAMAPRILCIEVNNRSVEGLPTQHNSRAHATASKLSVFATAEERSLLSGIPERSSPSWLLGLAFNFPTAARSHGRSQHGRLSPARKIRRKEHGG